MTTGWRRWHLNSELAPNFWDRLFRTSVASVRLHFRKPIVFMVVIAGSLAMFALFGMLGHDLTPGRLRAMFIPAPLDLVAHSQLGLTWAQAIAFVARVAFVGLVAGLVLQSGFRAARLLRVTLVYLVGVLCLLPINLLALYYVGIAASDPEGQLGPQRFTSLLLSIPLFVVVTALVAPMVGRAMSGGRLRPVLDHAAVWMLAAVSTKSWLSVAQLLRHPGENPFAVRGYVSAFVGLFVQSIVFGALILEGKESA